jgi:hypothetical protein
MFFLQIILLTFLCRFVRSKRLKTRWAQNGVWGLVVSSWGQPQFPVPITLSPIPAQTRKRQGQLKKLPLRFPISHYLVPSPRSMRFVCRTIPQTAYLIPRLAWQYS